jgi:hypothetical protein
MAQMRRPTALVQTITFQEFASGDVASRGYSGPLTDHDRTFDQFDCARADRQFAPTVNPTNPHSHARRRARNAALPAVSRDPAARGTLKNPLDLRERQFD